LRENLSNDRDNPGTPACIGFRAVEALQEGSEVAGWDAQYRQLEAGPLHALSVGCQLGEISLLRESASRSMEVTGSSPARTITAMAPLPGSDFHINGRRLRGDRIMLIPPALEIHTVSPAGGGAVSMHIPENFYYGHIRGLVKPKREHALAEIAEVKASWDVVGRFRQAMLDSLRGSHGGAGAAGADRNLVAVLGAIIESSGVVATRRDRYHRLSRRRILDRALEYIEAHFQSSVNMADLCTYAGVSQSTLGRLFARELNITPSAFLYARRLHEVRKMLKERHCEKSIARIAQDSGFTHMGRFSAAYRRQFGVLPSQDRRQSP
jgi:AraC family ethanolamine operon transcriptional activator